MLQRDPWLLPDGIEEVLPEDAKQLESLRRRLLDLFSCWGYELVIPPFIDYLNSLLTGSGRDLDLQTFKLTDQLTGEMLGIRSDMTPQVARIDAHNLKRDWPTRLCYAGTILHTRGDPLEKTRSPMQIGAEIYGHAGRESDLEVIRLLLEMLAQSGVLNVHLDLGHVGIYRSLSNQAGLTEEQETALFDVLQRKANPELHELLATFDVPEKLKKMLACLPDLNGGFAVLEKAQQTFAAADADVRHALADLKSIAEKLQSQFNSLPISFDLAELRGYHYHTGIVFAAFVPTVGREIARGGRYDNIGAVFGRARPATGFSADLKLLANLSKATLTPEIPSMIFAPFSEDLALDLKIRELRAAGQAVLQQLPGQSGGAIELCCSAVLTQENQSWVVKPLA
jgi:ATP phosphoribosyltransferase regulatory subunit